MKFKKAYPYNLIDDLLKDKEYYIDIDYFDLEHDVENIIQGMLDLYPINKHIPKRMQKIIRLYYVEDLTHAKIGQELGISGGRVGDIKRRALVLMRHTAYFKSMFMIR